MIRYIPMTVAVVLVVCACSSNPQVTTQMSEKDQIREAVFRYQFEFNASGLGKAANAYFLSVEDNKDPSPQLLKQFDGHRPPVKPTSASTLEPGTAQVLDRESGRPGLIFRITEIRWLNDDEVRSMEVTTRRARARPGTRTAWSRQVAVGKSLSVRCSGSSEGRPSSQRMVCPATCRLPQGQKPPASTAQVAFCCGTADKSLGQAPDRGSSFSRRIHFKFTLFSPITWCNLL